MTRALVLFVLLPAMGCAGASVCSVKHRTEAGTEVSALTRHGRVVRRSYDDGRGGRGGTRFSYDGNGRLRWTREVFSTRGFRHPHPSGRETVPHRYVIRTRYRYAGSTPPSSIQRRATHWRSSSATGRPDERTPPSDETLDVTMSADVVRMRQRANEKTTEYVYRLVHGALVSAVVTTDRHPVEWRYGYDDEGRLTTVEQPVDVCVPGAECHANRCRFTYGRGGRILEYECDAGHAGRYELDAAGRLVSAERGVATSYRYDAEGRVVAIESSSTVGALERFDYEGRCPAQVVRRFAPSAEPMDLVDEPPRPDLWPDELPLQ